MNPDTIPIGWGFLPDAMRSTVLKCCTKCNVRKPEDDFYPHPTSSGGRRTVCKACEIADAIRRARERRERMRRSEEKPLDRCMQRSTIAT